MIVIFIVTTLQKKIKKNIPNILYLNSIDRTNSDSDRIDMSRI